MAGTARPSLEILALNIVRCLRNAGHSAFWVGGCVRDFLLGRAPGDYDIATSARPEAIEALFKRTVAVGRKFGVIVVVEGELQCQVATFRAEADYRDGRRPETVVFSDARADALRRDFTINGLFYDPLEKKVHDWVGGEADLRARRIRTIGPPGERFAEDYLRLLRAVRFAARLGFTLEPDTLAALQQYAPRIRVISAERVREELVKLFAPPETPDRGQRLPRSALQSEAEAPIGAPAARGLVLLRDSGLLPHTLSEVAATISCEQSPEYHPEGTVFQHLCLMLEYLPPGADPLLPWAVLMHDIAKPVTAHRDARTGAIHFYGHEKMGATLATEILTRLRFPRKQIETVAQVVRYHMQFKDAPKMRPATLRRMLLRSTFPLELELHRLDCLASHGGLAGYDFLVAQAEALKHQPPLRSPLLTGQDLIDLGMAPGPALGQLLAELREKQLADEIKTKSAARAWARRRITG
ncbi:MAG: CCA-adding enzyme [Verrucomicrobia bacterium ADurb.Bin118]|jgi:poly(A) polymerase|nr:MAG: CCA-adding enzyme [Verrucomicrobia bacterium ADurb.Bin118]